jgi:hypothetical protein
VRVLALGFLGVSDLRRCGSGVRSICARGFLRGFAGCGICGFRVVSATGEGGRPGSLELSVLWLRVIESSAAAGGRSIFAAREATLAWIAGSQLPAKRSSGVGLAHAPALCARFDLLLPPNPESAATLVPPAAGLALLFTHFVCCSQQYLLSRRQGQF